MGLTAEDYARIDRILAADAAYLRKKHIAEGLEIGRQEAQRAAREEARQQTVAIFVHQFARKLGRELTAVERETVASRLGTLGPQRLGDVVLDYDDKALSRWLARPRKR